ncbi:hypothetical protein ABIA00_000376 [Bradyrhizobium ottawaense]|uniref:Ulp1 family isopeptidase n=1 Tax=Bradyrhizobium ottawaense TaxID=931866 RepID=UPI00383568ED
MDGGFFPNAGAWNSWYHEQVAQQSENVPADQASVEEQPDGLQLSASDEAEGSPGQARGVRRVDVGAMRQMLQSDLQSGRFISGRHSVDFPGASIDYPAGVPQSSLRAAGFASVRYTAPSGNASAPKGRHSLLSRAGSKLKSALGSIGGGGRKKTSGPSNEQEIVWSHSNPSADLNREDAELIEWYKDQLIREGVPAGRASTQQYASELRSLSRALAAKGQLPFASRLDDRALDAEARAVHRNALAALNHLRKLKGFTQGSPLYSKDEDLIHRFQKACANDLAGKTASNYSINIRDLSRWCFANKRGAIADRLNDPSLFDDADALPHARHVKSALRALQRVQDQLLVQQVDVSRQGPSGLSLGREEWLGDEHILADFTLLQHELERDNPILAGRTRFVDPLIAHQLREGAHNDMRGALQRVLYDRYGNDTAEFLFLPVNDASGTNRGTHWSLLLVDRRDRQRPVAYHYDSLGGHNDYVAAMLATRLNASQYAASIGQQRNGYDCGVFVVDGTRELVRRLAEGRRPNLRNLDNVVADRGGLQQRLSAAPGNARATDPAYQAGPSTRSVDSTEFWRGVDQAGQPAADSWNTANFWQGGPSFGHSPAQSVDQPGSFNSTAFWQGVDQAGQPAADSWNTANFWQGVQAPAYGAPSDIYAGLESFVDLNALRPSPSEQSVNPPSPSPWEHTEASILGATAHMPPPPPDLGEFVGPGWVHGKRKQRAPEDLMRGMHWHGVLPSADRHRTNIMINGRRYTAQLAPTRKQSEIYVYLNE